MTDLTEAVTRLLSARRGHYLLESGHHGDLWLDLELLCIRPAQVRPLAAELATRLRDHGPDAVCGPLIEGAFVASMVAEEMDVPFSYAEGRPDVATKRLFPVRYAVPKALRTKLNGLRVAVVNDVINAGSAVRGTVTDLASCGAMVVAIASLAVLGQSAAQFATEAGVPLVTLATLPNQIWRPAECPPCARGVPLDQP
jgi:orotate phosphoribosyltransferase